ncbi:hypothetical protein [Jeotgalibacillus soli]|uniref:Transcriptional regulator n=1 Tax=Jeotgalibacillus soli TaxID=889306 RepID=A0A0C2VMK4_9BACL|nr:hypothetical protein [Jeotgalibacillus soli]KIL45671.1 transcriptional regulator [Jeotgalibacillus soli]
MNLFKWFFMLIFAVWLAGCSSISSINEPQAVGLLVPGTIDDQVWGEKGYKGLLSI